MVFCGKITITTLKLIQNAKVGVFWKIQDICYIMGTEIFKIEEEITEKMKPEVANPPLPLLYLLPMCGTSFAFIASHEYVVKHKSAKLL